MKMCVCDSGGESVNMTVEVQEINIWRKERKNTVAHTHNWLSESILYHSITPTLEK
jgi:hypothetical protein